MLTLLFILTFWPIPAAEALMVGALAQPPAVECVSSLPSTATLLFGLLGWNIVLPLLWFGPVVIVLLWRDEPPIPREADTSGR
jgi:hypothetical protein